MGIAGVRSRACSCLRHSVFSRTIFAARRREGQLEVAVSLHGTRSPEVKGRDARGGQACCKLGFRSSSAASSEVTLGS